MELRRVIHFYERLYLSNRAILWGCVKMKEITGLYVILIAIFFVNLTNTTLFNGEWNGIAMWLSTGLFIAGTAYFFMSRDSIKKNK